MLIREPGALRYDACVRLWEGLCRHLITVGLVWGVNSFRTGSAIPERQLSP